MLIPKACACTNQPVRLKAQGLGKKQAYTVKVHAKEKRKEKSAQGLTVLNSSYILANLEGATFKIRFLT